ncbi:hypothetical protein ACQQ2N_17435 [Dokdonella sp. MW10]|uniref:hypothetical protein n=1 Tax=Dokdonella sp. MW10 TaxID=2992926 RepID=UPI003F804A5E
MSPPLPTEDDLNAWEMPDVTHLSEKWRSQFEDRRKAMSAVIRSGLKVQKAAKHFKVTRSTLSKALEVALLTAPDGEPWGWRACIPFRAQRIRSAPQCALPVKPLPHALQRLLQRLPALRTLLLDFRKPLPTRDRKSSAFDTFFKNFLAAVEKETDGVGYPFTSPDKGRRALVRFIHSNRRETPAVELETYHEERTKSAQVQEVFAFDVMERLEFDAHSMDCSFTVEVVDSHGRVTLQRISSLTLLVMIDAASRLVIAHSIVVGKGYTQVDVARLFAKALQIWEPRELIVPFMAYPDGSGVGTTPAVGRVQRCCLTAADNAQAHVSKFSTSSLPEHFKGVFNFGFPHVPETRAIIESFFKSIENGAIRSFPGGFTPKRNDNTPKPSTTGYRSEDHPLDIAAMRDLMDVIVSGFNATPLKGGDGFSPIEIVKRFGSRGGWSFESSRDDVDACALTKMRIVVTIKGDRKNGRQPYVSWMYARYRSFGLRDRWDLLNATFNAFVNLDDVRELTLLDRHGDVFAVLKALPPWSSTKHDYDLRRLVHRWGKRGLFEITGSDDAIASYIRHVRANAATNSVSAEQVIKYPNIHKNSPTRPDTAPRDEVILPRSGSVSFATIKDSSK